MRDCQDPALQKREAQWKVVSAQLKVSVYLSIGAALTADGLARWVPSPIQLADDWGMEQQMVIYLSLLYAVVLPVLLVRMFNALREYKVPRRSLPDRLLFAVLAGATLPVIIALPALLLLMGPQTVGRAHSAYMFFTGSLIGTALGGGVMAYAAAIAGWMLVGGMRQLLFQRY